MCGVDDELYDFGIKGLGRIFYFCSVDGRFIFKGGVCEVLVVEILYCYGVCIFRCLSLIEIGEGLWCGDEFFFICLLVMVCFSCFYICFGIFERFYFYKCLDLMKKLLNYVINCYYFNLKKENIF